MHARYVFSQGPASPHFSNVDAHVDPHADAGSAGAGGACGGVPALSDGWRGPLEVAGPPSSSFPTTVRRSFARTGGPESPSSSTFGGGAKAFVGAGAVITVWRGVTPGAAIIIASSVGMFGTCESATYRAVA